VKITLRQRRKVRNPFVLVEVLGERMTECSPTPGKRVQECTAQPRVTQILLRDDPSERPVDRLEERIEPPPAAWNAVQRSTIIAAAIEPPETADTTFSCPSRPDSAR
jgi:hypothetical protein